MEIETTTYRGESYYRYPESKRRTDRVYFKKVVVYLHRKVWEDNYGEIPKGYHVHHINGDTADNRIENLELRTPKEHIAEHEKNRSKEFVDKRKANVDRIRPLAKEWHRSEEGRKWHAEHAKTAFPESYGNSTCKNCGKEYTKKMPVQEYCSNACKSSARRKSGVDDIGKTCPVCGKEFKSSKYAKRIFCSKSCARTGVSRKKRSV
jgi:endogenous inhibitor of DNA gyrase (YacG/DUF329 family)